MTPRFQPHGGRASLPQILHLGDFMWISGGNYQFPVPRIAIFSACTFAARDVFSDTFSGGRARKMVFVSMHYWGHA